MFFCWDEDTQSGHERFSLFYDVLYIVIDQILQLYHRSGSRRLLKNLQRKARGRAVIPRSLGQ